MGELAQRRRKHHDDWMTASKAADERCNVEVLFDLLGIELAECVSTDPPAPDVRAVLLSGEAIAIEVVRLFDEELKRTELGLQRLASDVEQELQRAGVVAYVRLGSGGADVGSLGASARRRVATSIAVLAQRMLAEGTRAADAARLRAGGVQVLRRLLVVPTGDLIVDPAPRAMTIGIPAHVRDAVRAKADKACGYRAAIGPTSLWLLAVTGTEFANGDGAHVLRDLLRPPGFDRAFVLDHKSGYRVIELQSDTDPEKA